MVSTFFDMPHSPVHMLTVQVTLYPLQWLTLYENKKSERFNLFYSPPTIPYGL
jgi:hypothetical protein